MVSVHNVVSSVLHVLEVVDHIWLKINQPEGEDEKVLERMRKYFIAKFSE